MDGADSGDGSNRAGFLGFVAHEVRNPLSTALWSAELLSRMSAEQRSGSRGERLSAMCLRSIARVRQLVEDHFLCERLDAGGILLRFEPIPLREVIETILARPGDRGPIDVRVDTSLAVNADRTLVERALDALVAVASADKAAVRIEAGEASGGRIALTVAGHAPAPGALEDPTKGSPSDARGRSLALPLARRIAAALGGALAASEAGYVLSLPEAEGYIARPKPAAHP
ncbi:MAG TPA: histidine kinase dimerization/phospho-acceptor domain-containing protein [Anaeromyxobacter sp.]